MRSGHIIHLPFGMAYGSDKGRVLEVILAAADDVSHTQKVVPGHKPMVCLLNFRDSSLDFRPGKVQAEYHRVIHTVLTKAGIQIPFPQRDIHVKSMPEARS